MFGSVFIVCCFYSALIPTTLFNYEIIVLGLSHCDDVLPIYVGDDRTDEDAFKVISTFPCSNSINSHESLNYLTKQIEFVIGSERGQSRLRHFSLLRTQGKQRSLLP